MKQSRHYFFYAACLIFVGQAALASQCDLSEELVEKKVIVSTEKFSESNSAQFNPCYDSRTTAALDCQAAGYEDCIIYEEKMELFPYSFLGHIGIWLDPSCTTTVIGTKYEKEPKEAKYSRVCGKLESCYLAAGTDGVSSLEDLRKIQDMMQNLKCDEIRR